MIRGTMKVREPLHRGMPRSDLAFFQPRFFLALRWVVCVSTFMLVHGTVFQPTEDGISEYRIVTFNAHCTRRWSLIECNEYAVYLISKVQCELKSMRSLVTWYSTQLAQWEIQRCSWNTAECQPWNWSCTTGRALYGAYPFTEQRERSTVTSFSSFARTFGIIYRTANKSVAFEDCHDPTLFDNVLLFLAKIRPICTYIALDYELF